MVLYSASTVVYLYERSLHIVFFFLILIWFILSDFLLLLLFLNQEGPFCSLYPLCTTLLLPLISVGTFSLLITSAIAVVEKERNAESQKRTSDLWMH